MKNIVLFLSIIALLCSCSKEKNVEVRYEFNADVSASYQIEYATSDNLLTETVNGTSWSKTVGMKQSTQIAGSVNGASLTAYPPAAWKSTSDKAHITLKIFLDGEERNSADTVLTGANYDQGIRVLITF